MGLGRLAAGPACASGVATHGTAARVVTSGKRVLRCRRVLGRASGGVVHDSDAVEWWKHERSWRSDFRSRPRPGRCGLRASLAVFLGVAISGPAVERRREMSGRLGPEQKKVTRAHLILRIREQSSEVAVDGVPIRPDQCHGPNGSILYRVHSGHREPARRSRSSE